MRDYLEGIDTDPARLDQVQARMDVIDRLKKKYGGSISTVLESYGEYSRELAAVDNYDADMAKLEEDIAALYQRLRGLAAELTERRQKAGAALSAEIERELQELGMPKARFIFLSHRRENTRAAVRTALQ